MTRLYLACYRGRSWFPSRLIQWQTWSKYSHVSMAAHDTDSGTWANVEAWHPDGVRETDGLLIGHDPKTRVDLFEYVVPLTEFQILVALSFARAQAGDPYDWRGCLSFVLRRRMQRDGAWFCSELVAESMLRAGRPIYNCDPWKVSPGMVAISPVVRRAAAVISGLLWWTV